VVYGWVFFGLIIAVLMGVGWRYFDRSPTSLWLDGRGGAAVRGAPPKLAACGVLLLVLLAWAWAVIAAGGAQPLPKNEGLPSVPGWTRIAAQGDVIPWRPNFTGADRLLMARYVDARGRKVDFAVAIFSYQAEGRELVGFGQGAIGPDSRWSWTNDMPAPANGQAFRITGPGDVQRDVVTFYRVGDIVTGNEMMVKLETLKAKLTGGPRRGVALIVTAPGERGRAAVDSFLARLGPIDRLADRLAGQKG